MKLSRKRIEWILLALLLILSSSVLASLSASSHASFRAFNAFNCSSTDSYDGFNKSYAASLVETRPAIMSATNLSESPSVT